MKILVVLGTRPEAIKLSPVIDRLKRRELKVKVCVTAQHREMLDPVLNLFGIRPDYDLDLMKQDQTLFQLTADSLRDLEKVFKNEQPDIVIVQGDTTTVFAAALAAYYLRIKVGHVEAGLRSGDPSNPFPEEMNRRFTDALSDWCFAPTLRAHDNLINEGVANAKVFVTGNTIIDALYMIVGQQADEEHQSKFYNLFAGRYRIPFDRRLILATAHRRESFGPDFESICLGLKKIAEHFGDVRIVFPVHLNPTVQRTAYKVLDGTDRVHLIEPLGYAEFVWLLRKCYLVVTDSGGVQEEAPSLGKPVLIARTVTERPEGVEAGVARLVGTDSEAILQAASELLEDPALYARMARAVKLYGDGHAAERIAQYLAVTC